MAGKTCFVIMPIGEQAYNGNNISSAELKRRYDDLIKEAVLKARPDLDVKRADEVALPGTITSDIITRLMHSDYVVADVSYPNPNVFYELGMRHSCRVGTIIIKDRAAPNTPFDISQLRHIEYDNTATGLKALAETLKTYFDHFERVPSRPDNQFLEIAKLTGYKYPDFSVRKDEGIYYAREDQTILYTEFPKRFQSDLEKAEEIYMVGVSLSSTIEKQLGVLKEMLRNNLSIKVLIRNPKGKHTKMILEQSYIGMTTKHIKNKINHALDLLCELKKISPDNVEIRVVDHHFSFGCFAFDSDKANGKIYIEHYPFKIPENDIPKLFFDVSTNKYWFDLYKRQLNELWSSGEEWICDYAQKNIT